MFQWAAGTKFLEQKKKAAITFTVTFFVKKDFKTGI